MKKSVKQAIQQLEQYKTEQEIYEFFKANNIYGVPRSVHSCPVARYLGKETGKDVAVVNWYVAWKEWFVWERTATLPPQVAAFINSFDLGCYSSLFN